MPLPRDAAIACAVASIPDAELPRYREALEARLAYARTHQIERYFPARGPYRRELYPKHLDFFRAGARYTLRFFCAGNRVGKTRGACYEDATHGIGVYPPWWEGRRFERPVKGWVCAVTSEKIKETVQAELLGPPNAWGTGLIPADRIAKIDKASGSIKDLVDTIWLYHGRLGREQSRIALKSYKQGRQAFEGEKKDFIHDDEEPPFDVFGEQLLRLADTDGHGTGAFYLTFTPMQGVTETVLSFLPDGQLPTGEQPPPRYVVNASWDDVPHLTAETKHILLATMHPHLIDARTRGIPVLGSGVIFPVAESQYVVDPFEIPKHWLRCYGMDVGWRVTGGPWGAYDQETDTWYLYHEYYGMEAQPSVHAAATRGAGAWIPGVIDPAANGRSQDDGQRLLTQYLALGLHLTMADNDRWAGIYEIWERLSTGRLKVFTTMTNWLREARTFARDAKGRIIQEQDFHMIASTRYLMLSGRAVAKPFPVPVAPRPQAGPGMARRGGGWMRG